MAQMVKNLPEVRESWVRSLGWEDPLEEEMALHIGFSRGGSGGLVFPSLEEFSTVYCDPHS